MNREIRICYCKIISADDSGAWEQLVFADTYRKFLLQVQHFDRRQKYSTYEIVHQVPGSQRLDFLVSTAITGYRKQLNNLFPDVKNVLGKKFLPFHNYRFEMISSNIRAQSGQRTAVIFYSDRMYWIDAIGEQLLLLLKEANDEVFTELLPLKPFISIYSVKDIK